VKLFKRDIPAEIVAENAALGTAAGRLAELQAARNAVLLEGDEAAIARQDAGIAAVERRIRAHQDRITLLEAALAEQQRAAQAREYAAAIDATEKLIEPLDRAAVEVEAALRVFLVSVRMYRKGLAAVRSEWPTNLPAPRWQLDAARLGVLLQRSFEPRGSMASGDVVYKYTLRPPDASDYLARILSDGDTPTAGFAAEEKAIHVRLIAELRAPAPAEPESAEAA
jgi:hypothetical protein